MPELTLAQPSANAAGAALIAKHRGALALHEGRPIAAISKNTTLIPRDDLPPLIAVLKARMQPASRKELAGAIALIAASWPHGHQRPDQAVLDAHTRLLAEDLGDFPADILAEVLSELRRTLKWSPSIAEIYGPAAELLAERRARLDIAEQHLAEHERREAAERAEAQRAEAWRRETEARIAKLADALGDPFIGCTVERFELASEGMRFAGWQISAKWSRALDAAEPWTGAVFPIAVLVGSAAGLYRDRKIADAEVTQLIALGVRDLGRAQKIVAALEAGEPPERVLDRSEESIWGPPERLLAEIVAKAQAAELETAP
jgi:hypothetical protein